MQIVQVSMAVPDEVYAGILAGALDITAGIVRDNKGIIRNHLPKVATQTKEAAAQVVNSRAVINVIKQNKVAAIAVGAATVVGGSAAYLVHRSKQKKAETQDLCVKHFQKALKSYLKKAKTGQINADVVAELLSALKEVQESKAGDAAMLTIPAAQLDALINSIFDYTRRLAEANAFETVKVKAPKRGAKNSIVNLTNYLEIQKQIIEQAA